MGKDREGREGPTRDRPAQIPTVQRESGSNAGIPNESENIEVP